MTWHSRADIQAIEAKANRHDTALAAIRNIVSEGSGKINALLAAESPADDVVASVTDMNRHILETVDSFL